MASMLDFIRFTLEQQFGRQCLRRLEEPSSITDDQANVVQYDRVMSTKLVLAYAAGLEIVFRAVNRVDAGTAIDLACGPGHYTICLAKYLNFERVVGVDLSRPMIETAQRNVLSESLSNRTEFSVKDIRRLSDVDDKYFDLASFTDAAHHMPDILTVQAVLQEMDRVVKSDGLIMVMDLARLRTAGLTESYVSNLGRDYVDSGLPQFFDDFRNSMYAAWTTHELREAIPIDTDRFWCHLVPRGLPTIQVILGLPVGRKRLFLRRGFPWRAAQNPVPQAMRWEWQMLRQSLNWGSRTYIEPRNRVAHMQSS